MMLIVEDNPDMQTLLADIFAAEGYGTILAGSAKAALHISGNHVVDVVLLDKRLPDLDGFEIISSLRRFNSRIVVLTAYGDVRQKKEALLLGADAYMTKPFLNTELIELVKKIMRRKQNG